ncbi:MAG: GntR family transcriptional regulator [Verrucomicrobia bacterium]|nr:GntR family transcriptional regulator [Verrucomicrobiota bacterium]
MKMIHRQTPARTVAEVIKNRVRSLKLCPGDRLPPMNRLAKLVGITDYQLRKALVYLKDNKGWIQIRGSGTYLPGGRRPIRPKKKLIAIVGPWPEAQLSTFDECQRMARARGYGVMVINATPDPKEERTYLENLVEQDITALCMEPTPIPPCNFEIIDRFLALHAKVALFTVPPNLEHNYSVFSLDYYRAGYLGIGHLMKKGVRKVFHITFLTGGIDDPWQEKAMGAGARQAADDFDIDLDIVRAKCVFNEERQVLEWQKVETEIPFKKGIGYLCDHHVAARLLKRQLEEAGISDTEIFTVHNARVSMPFPYAFLDEQERLRRMMSYALDGRIPPHRKIREQVSPVVIHPQEAAEQSEQPAMTETTSLQLAGR